MENTINTTEMSLFQKLVEVRKSAMYVAKTESGFKDFKYAGTAELLAYIRPKMDELHLLLVPNIEEMEIVTLRKREGEVQVPKIKLSYTWINGDKPEERLQTFHHFFDDKMSGAQGIGSLLTYAERYFLYKFFQVATDEAAPEQFYKKYELSSLAEIVPPVKKKEEKKIEPALRKPREYYQGMGQYMWELLRASDPSLPMESPSELSSYLAYCQDRRPNVDLNAVLPEVAKKPQDFLNGMTNWNAKVA